MSFRAGHLKDAHLPLYTLKVYYYVIPLVSNIDLGRFIYMYTSQLWWNYKKCRPIMKRLLITYHNVFKMSISMSKYESRSLLCTVYNVLCCQAVIRNVVYRFMCRLQACNHSLVMSIQSSSLVYTSRIRKQWRRLLYVNV